MSNKTNRNYESNTQQSQLHSKQKENMRVYFKETIWYTVDVEEGQEAKALELIKQKNATASTLMDEHLGEGEFSYDLALPMTVEENEGYSTIEAFDEDHNRIFENGIS